MFSQLRSYKLSSHPIKEKCGRLLEHELIPPLPFQNGLDVIYYNTTPSTTTYTTPSSTTYNLQQCEQSTFYTWSAIRYCDIRSSYNILICIIVLGLTLVAVYFTIFGLLTSWIFDNIIIIDIQYYYYSTWGKIVLPC